MYICRVNFVYKYLGIKIIIICFFFKREILFLYYDKKCYGWVFDVFNMCKNFYVVYDDKKYFVYR